MTCQTLVSNFINWDIWSSELGERQRLQLGRRFLQKKNLVEGCILHKEMNDDDDDDGGGGGD